MRTHKSKLTLSDSIALHNELVVLIAHKEPHKPQSACGDKAIHLEEQIAGFLNHLAVMVNFFPDIPSLDTQSSVYIFSGS